jgi:hypothetical protein
MANLQDLLSTFRRKPCYTLMRGAARFAVARSLVAGTRRAFHGARLAPVLDDCEQRIGTSPFAAVDRAAFVSTLHRDGIAEGLRLPEKSVRDIVDYASASECYADRKPEYGFKLGARSGAEAALGKPILVAQYFNTEAHCAAIRQLVDDPVLRWIAGRYLESVPVFAGINLWWTFPVKPLERDRDLHAHLFHRDVDDFRFFKFFFYLTPVNPGDGAHVCVASSQRKPPVSRLGDPWNLRRYGDDEISRTYPPSDVREICGPAGTGFGENTLCIHKGLTPTGQPRLLLQLQFALFDYGVMHDRRDPASLRTIA